MKRKMFIALAICALLGAVLYAYMYKEHRDIASESADFSLTVKELQQQFSNNPEAANLKFADKTLEVSGALTAVDVPSHTLTVDEKLSAVFKDSVMPKTTNGKAIKIKGRFVGYDDLLEEFKMDQAAVSE